MRERLLTGEHYEQKAWEPQWVMDMVVTLLTCMHGAVLPHLDRVFHGADARPRSAKKSGRSHWIQQSSKWALERFKETFDTLDTSDLWERQELNLGQIDKIRAILRLFVEEAAKGVRGRWQWAPLAMDEGEINTVVEDASAALLSALMRRSPHLTWIEIIKDDMI